MTSNFFLSLERPFIGRFIFFVNFALSSVLYNMYYK